MARVIPLPVEDRVTDDAGLMSPAWQEWLDGTASRPTCLAYVASGGQSIATGTETDVTWPVVGHDNAEMLNSTNTDRITIPEDGTYVATVALRWAASAVGDRVVVITLNDPAPAASTAWLVWLSFAGAAGLSDNPGFNLVTPPTQFVQGDVLRVLVYQDSGGALAVGSLGASSPYAGSFGCHKVGY